jgi:preprotein translocase subunit Sec61beta
MSRKKRRRQEAPQPASSAGLFRFFEESTDSFIKLRPELVVIIAGFFVVMVILASTFIAL